MVISEANLSDDKNITDTKENQDKKLCYIYKHIRLDRNEVFYIGKGTNTRGNYSRSKSKNRDNSHWHNVVNKHGYKIEIVVENLTEQEANEKEMQYILDYGRIDLSTGTLVNMTAGGDGSIGHKHTEEAKKKMSEATKGNTRWLGKTHTEEAKKKISDAKKGNNTWLGKKHTEESKKKNSKSNKGKKMSDEAKKKISEFHKGKKKTLEQIEKRYKPVGQYKDGNLIKEYPSIKATTLDGFNSNGVSRCCRGKITHHGEFQWKFI